MSEPTPHASIADTLMWEARAQPGRLEALLRWVDETALPRLRDDPECRDVDVYIGGQDRAVLIVRYRSAVANLPEPPADLLSRPVHQWPFRHRRTDRS